MRLDTWMEVRARKPHLHDTNSDRTSQRRGKKGPQTRERASEDRSLRTGGPARAGRRSGKGPPPDPRRGCRKPRVRQKSRRLPKRAKRTACQGPGAAGPRATVPGVLGGG